MDEWLSRLLVACLSGCLVIGVVWMACRLLPRLSGAVRCWLWWLVCLKLFLGLIALPTITLPLLPQPSSPAPVYVPYEEDSPSASKTQNTPAPAKAAENERPSLGPEEPTPTDSPLRWSHLLFGVWLIGVGIGIGMQANALLQLRRLAAHSERLESPSLTEAAEQAGLIRIPLLRASPSPIEPLTVGWLRPYILISQADLSRLSPEELRAVLAHECVHIRRGDLWLSLVPWLSQTIFWFFPLVHLAVREYQLAREAACDQQTITALSLQPRTYGELLVKLSSPASPLTTPSSVTALSADFRQLKRRIEMLEIQRTRRSLLVITALVAVGVLIPWRLTSAAQTGNIVEQLPNLDFAQGIAKWQPNANGSPTDPHPFYEVGQDTKVTHEGKPSAFVRSTQKSAYDSAGDGGVLRYDIVKSIRKYQGKRMRLSAYVKGKDITKQAFLFIAVDALPNMNFGTSAHVTSAGTDWQRVECVTEIPQNAGAISLGLRLEGEGIAYASGFRFEEVEKSVPTTAVRIIDVMPGARNLTFAEGLDGWWNDDPTHMAEDEYRMDISPKGGRTGGPAAYLKNKVARPKTYGTIAQNASPKQYLGKRIRFSAYLKTENADQGELWIVVSDTNPEKSDGRNADSTGKTIKGTKDWTKFEYEIDIPKTTEGLSFGISSTGKGTVWVDGFQIEVLGDSRK